MWTAVFQVPALPSIHEIGVEGLENDGLLFLEDGLPLIKGVISLKVYLWKPSMDTLQTCSTRLQSPPATLDESVKLNLTTTDFLVSRTS